MKERWQTTNLGEVLAVLRNGVNRKQDKSGRGFKISRIETISDATFNPERVGYADLTPKEKEQYRLQAGDILFSHINSAVHVGKTAIFDSPEPFYHGVNLLLMRPKDMLSSSYLEFFLKYLFRGGYWRGVCKQSVNQASVNQQDIARVEIHYPNSIPEQRRIVGILDEAFDGIATAKTNAEKNLQNARALFESHLQSVFIQRGVGWVETSLGDEINLLSGFPFKSSQYTKSGNSVRLLRGDNIVQGSLRWDDVKRWPASDTADYKSYELSEGDVVLAMDRPWVKAGLKRAQISADDLPCLLVQRTARLRGNGSLNNRFLVYLISSGAFTRHILGVQTGIGVPHISGQQIKDFRFPKPPMKDQVHFAAQLDDLSTDTQRLESIYQQKLAALEELKKSLLHQAFTGAL